MAAKFMRWVLGSRWRVLLFICIAGLPLALLFTLSPKAGNRWDAFLMRLKN